MAASGLPRRKQSQSVTWAVLGLPVLLGATAPQAPAEDAKSLAYGRHLARECTSCHRLDGVHNGIPSIIGWQTDMFITTLKFYRDGARSNPVMISVASSLSDEQMQALAVFFASVPKPAKKDLPGGKTVKQ
jgi:cytochrome c553